MGVIKILPAGFNTQQEGVGIYFFAKSWYFKNEFLDIFWKGTEAVITGRSRPALNGGLARVV